MRRTVVTLLFLVALLYISIPAFAQQRFFPAPEDGIPDQYIVVLERGARLLPSHIFSVSNVADKLTKIYGGRIIRIWEHALKGFLVEIDEQAAQVLSQDSGVKLVSQNFFVQSLGSGVILPVPECNPMRPGQYYPDGNYAKYYKEGDPFSGPSPQPIQCGDPDPYESPPPAYCLDNWGLDRIDSLKRIYPALQDRDGLYYFPQDPGQGVHVYVIGTGLYKVHTEFEESRIGEG